MLKNDYWVTKIGVDTAENVRRTLPAFGSKYEEPSFMATQSLLPIAIEYCGG